MTVTTRPSLRKHLPNRIGEWIACTFLLILGVGLWLAPGTLARPGLASFSAYAPPFGWSGFALGLVAERVSSLYVNGHGARASAPMRLVGCIISATFFGALLGRFLAISTPDAPAIGVYFSLTFLLLEGWNSTRAMKDSLAAWRLRF
jgi:hypothetical protein